ncbi:MAG: hypothetical protein H0V09_04090 [Gemmatimonadetes bacterium]|nr:hypothetical protein [Gemmatimonadota bacterium]
MRAATRATAATRARGALQALLLVLALCGGGSAAAPAQQEPSENPPPTAGGGETPLVVPEKPSVHQYRVAGGLAAFAWDEDVPADDGPVAGIDVERDLAPFLAVRAGLRYGTTEFRALASVVDDETGEDGASGELATGEAVDTRLYLPELALLLQADLGPLRDTPLVPYAVLGFGSLITDPDREGLTTHSQNAFGYGLGARLRLGGRLGARGEVERYLLKLEDVLGESDDPANRDSRSVHNLRFGGSLTYAL